MARPVILSNGRVLVGLNEKGLVHDFYYPYVGLDNLTSARISAHRIGVWVNNQFSWIDSDGWQTKVDFEESALVSDIVAINQKLGVELRFKDFVDERYDLFGRIIEVKNLNQDETEIRLFLHQDFQISRGGRGDTALYVPESHYVLDYKGWCSLLIYAQDEDGKPFDQFAVGNYGIEGKEGTFKDAEDGALSDNLVEHGGVDSVIRCSLQLKAGESKKINYWIIASDSQFDAEIIHHVLIRAGLQSRLQLTRETWNDWLSISQERISQFDPKYQIMAKKSLMVIKAHTDSRGGVIASCDSSIYNYGRDYYTYVWPRDGAWIMIPMIELGYLEEPRKFFDFCADTIHPRGYMMHKYQPDKAVGSTWHPLMHKAYPELAIQEDETAIVIYALGLYFEKTKDIDYIRHIYNHLVMPAANFMVGYVDESTGLPHASYDLWEQKFATHTYTVAVVVAALAKAADMAEALGQPEDSERWKRTSAKIATGLASLYKEDKKYFRKSVMLNDGKLEYDDTIDISSAYGPLYFMPPGTVDNKMFQDGFATLEKELLNNAPIGGMPRYNHDDYFLAHREYLGNPWILTTLWMAQYYMQNGKIEEAIKLIDWAVDRASDSGMLAEQVDPLSGTGIGVSPLTWSHSTFLHTLLGLSAHQR